MVNIFVSHYNPRRSAEAQPDLLCQRMCLEAIEVLNSAQWTIRLGDKPTPTREEVPDAPHLPPYRRSYSQRRHPICRWAVADRAHYVWLLKHAEALADEHKRRYQRDYPAPYRDCFEWLSLRSHLIPTSSHETPVKASSLTFYGAFNDPWVRECSDDIRIQYRLQLLAKWCFEYKRRHTWHDGPPDWAYDESLLQLVRKYRGQRFTTSTAKELYHGRS